MADVSQQADEKRTALPRLIYRRLKDPSFRRRLTVGPDGSRPIVVALPTDLMLDVVKRTVDSGGMINVVVPYLNGAVIFTVRAEVEAGADAKTAQLKDDCTVGLLLERVRLTSEPAFHFVVDSGNEPQRGEAELVALA